MFGPDKCGHENDKVHFIFRHQNPLTKEWEEKHLVEPPKTKVDKLTHLYTLHVTPDSSFTIEIDGKTAAKGSLFENFNPPVNPPAEIDDITDKKPKNWVDKAEIPDLTATKPNEWDENQPARIIDEDAVIPHDWLENEPEEIPDPSQEKPVDWNDEEDGEFIAATIPNPKCSDVSGCGKWERPTKPNPLYKGKWKAPLIPNPEYKGPLLPRKIPNPNYYEDKHPHNFKSMVGVGIEVWQMSKGIMFDNILITTDKSVADKFAQQTFFVKQPEEKLKNKDDASSDEDDLSLYGRLTTYIQYLQDIIEQFIVEVQRNPLIGVATALSLLLPIGICFMAVLAKPDPKKARATKQTKEESKDVSTEKKEVDTSTTPSEKKDN